MPRSWPALPLPSDPRVLVKAPDYNTFKDQEFDAEHFRLPRIPSAHKEIAAAIMDAVPDIKQMGLGDEFVLRRYPKGLTVDTPSGWSFMMPFDIPKDGPAKPKEVAEPNPSSRRGRGGSTS